MDKFKKIKSLINIKERTLNEVLYKITNIQKEYSLTNEDMLTITQVFFREEMLQIKNKEYKPSVIRKRNKNIELANVFEKFCKILNTSPELMKSPTRIGYAVKLRHIIAHSLRIRKFSFEQIASILERADHTTIMHAVGKVNDLIADVNDDSEYRLQMMDMFKMLNPNIEEYVLISKEFERNSRDILTSDIKAEDFIEHISKKISKKNK